ncbi:glycosyltransferase [Paenibacillus gallinarum]|uniref:Glycosyltransferase n=1 Tax=Paenibacillus gallinarum TaxID=2762232 RepID=A0ABR8T4D1_9BACL|nr:glycosyltransferase [Paenibacillus gallinarum]MBD7970572.1 glycosyltransferase [Paenibacillus gallinarum]
MRKKNILLTVPNLDSGGAERVVSRISEILNEDYNVFIALFDGSVQMYECKGEVINLNLPAKKNMVNKLLRIVQRIYRLKKVKKQYKIDTSISFLETANIINILSKHNEKTVISVRNYIKKERGNGLIDKIYVFLIKILFNRADYIVPVSKLLGQSLQEDYKINRDKIKVVYNPYNVDEISSLSQYELEPRYKDFFTGENTVISIGRLSHQKGYWHLIKAFKLVNEDLPSSKLVIIGQGPQEEKIKSLIDEYELCDSVLLLGYQSNPFKYIKNSDLYVMTSLFEGFPNALVEAMACKKPVISTDCRSGPREILFDNSELNICATEIEYADYGVIVPPLLEYEDWSTNIDYSDKVLAKAIMNVLTDDQIQTKYSRKAYNRAHDFSYQNCKKILDEIIGL